MPSPGPSTTPATADVDGVVLDELLLPPPAASLGAEAGAEATAGGALPPAPHLKNPPNTLAAPPANVAIGLSSAGGTGAGSGAAEGGVSGAAVSAGSGSGSGTTAMSGSVSKSAKPVAAAAAEMEAERRGRARASRPAPARPEPWAGAASLGAPPRPPLESMILLDSAR